MCKFIGKSNERILCRLSKREILRLYSVVQVAMETTKTSHFTSQSKPYISIFFTCQVSTCELQPFSYHDLANDIYSQTAKTVFSHLKSNNKLVIHNSIDLRAHSCAFEGKASRFCSETLCSETFCSETSS